MLAHRLQSIAESGISIAFCQASIGHCLNRDCSGSPKDERYPPIDSELPWLLGSCSLHAITSIVHLLFLLMWSIGFFRKGFDNLFRPTASAIKQDTTANGEKLQKSVTYVVTSRTRDCIISSIVLSAFLFVLNLVLGVLDLVLRWTTGRTNPLVHVEATTWILAAAWLVLTIASNSTRIQKKQDIPLLVRAWWMAAFILSLFSLVPNILSYRESGQLTPEAWLETASIPVTAFLFVVALFGRTGVNIVQDKALNEPLLGERTTPENTSTDRGPGVTPYATAGFFSLISISWINPLFAAGFKKPLELNDVPLPAPGDTSEYNYSKFKYNWDKQIEDDPAKPPSLLLAVCKSFWRGALFNAVIAGTNAVAGYVGPFLIEDFVEYLAGRRRFAYEGYALILAFFLAKLVETIAARAWFLGMQFLGLHFRSSLTAFVYRKGLRLSSQARQGHTTGEIINYVSVDVQRIGDFSWYFHDIWVLPLQVVLALLILYKVVGLAAISALVASLFVVVCNIPLAKMQDSYQDKLMAAKDKRMKALTESLKSMLILKLQAWETEYLSRIEKIRKVEYRHLRGSLFTSSALTFVFWTAPMFVSVATFGTCVLLGTPLTAGRILSALATFRVLQEPLSNIPELISMITQTKVSLERLGKYLVEEELQEDAVIHASPMTGEAGMAIEIDDADFKWNPSVETPILQNVNLHIKKGQRVAICGTVGSGKSSLVSSILGEIPRVSGRVKVYGTTAYVAQTAWIQSGKIEENILFGMPMDRRKYEEILRVCSLKKDMEIFAYGDQTMIGERGINMSGGQKQRIQLARAVYQDSDICLLDDPFSAVDAHTGSDLFQECILGLLRNKTVLYVTHQVEFLPAADLILVMRGGKIVQAGKYDDLLQAGTDFNTLVDAHNEAIDLMGSSGYKEKAKEGDASEVEMDVTEKDEPVEIIRQLSKKKSVEEIVPEQNKRQLVEDEERERGNISFAVYWTYLTSVYKGRLIPLIILAQIIFQVLQIASNYWMAWSTPATAGQSQRVDNKTLIFVYCIFAFGSSVFISIRAVLVSIVGLLAAQKFFMNMLRAIFHAPMSFFDSTPTGRILSRASSDQNTLDTEILYTFSGFMWTAIQLLGIVIVMSQITWKIILLFMPVTIACIAMQRYYIKTARELQRLVGILKSPIIHHYGESIAGAVTIRGFGQDQRFLETNLGLYDKYGRAVFHNFTAIQWLMFRMEMLSTFVFTFSLFYAVNYIGGMDPGLAGLAVTYGLQLNMIQTWFVWTLCNLENRVISVERLLQYTRVKSEAPVVIDDSRPPADWPNQGNIELHDLKVNENAYIRVISFLRDTMRGISSNDYSSWFQFKLLWPTAIITAYFKVRYNDYSPLVLRGITCTFPGGEKIGVVGRTGSGKSTLIQTLFRIVELSGGKIVIDGVDISKIGLHDLRNKLSIIPQDPTLFEGTMRANLDPLEQYSDADIWQALDKCQLGDVIRAKEDKLDCPVNENGENWSVGQRQLVCLGRALLKCTTILVLDEATASVDTATDGVIQRTVRTEFRECTVITVAHRIPTVIDSDRALVLSDGRIAEYESPMKLLEDKKSFFYKLVSEYSSRSKSVNDLVKLE